MNYFESIRNAEDESIDLMIEESEQNQKYLETPRTQKEEQEIINEINSKMDSILNEENKKLDDFLNQYNQDTTNKFLKFQVEEQAKHVAIIKNILERD